MDNMHEPPSGDPQDFRPTEEMGSSPREPGQGWGQPSGQPGQGWGQPSGQAGPPAPHTPPSRPRRHGGAVWWGAGLALVALLAGGGVAAAELSSSSSVAGGPTGQAAQLNTVLNSASSPTADASLASLSTGSTAAPCLSRAEKLKAAGHPTAAKIVLRRCGHRLRRLRLLGGIHGEFTFETKTGPRTLAYERGVIESVSGSDIVVQAKDGTTWTWLLESNTVIRQNGQKTTASALSNGEHVFAGGPVASGGYDARLIVIKPNSGSAPSSGSTPSPSPTSGS
jgi:hypothetical protein